jgi:hypothetical protein
MSRKLPKKKSSGTNIYFILFILLGLASIVWVQNSTRPKNFAQDVTPLLRCESPCSYHSQCPTGLFCYNGSCRNPECKEATDCTCVITLTPNPDVPTNTPIGRARPAKVSPSRVSPTEPAVTVRPSPSIIVIISPYPTIEATPELTPTPVFEIDKEAPQKKSILEMVLDFVANIFCKIFGC